MEEWYYTTNNQQMGPVSWDELRQLASTGLVKPADMLWKDGMSDWIKASKKDGLFSARAASKAEPEAEERPRRRAKREEDDAEPDDRPRRRASRDDDEEGEDRPRRRRRKPEGMPVGAKVAIIGGSVAVGLVVLIVVIVLLVRSGGGGGGGRGPGAFTVTLQPGQQNMRMIHFQAGQMARISVLSTVTHPMTDVDLIVERANGGQVAMDVALTKDCNVTFMPPASEAYRVRVMNLGPGSATCAVTHN